LQTTESTLQRRQVVTPAHVLQKVERELRERPSAPRFGGLGFGFWLWRTLSDEELETLAVLEREVGALEANRRTVAAMIASGKYRDAGNGEVERV
jgi:hypothetical protein